MRLRQELLGLNSPYPAHGRISYPCCSQFWVARERIRLHPPIYYDRIFNALTNPTSNGFYRILGSYPPAGTSNERYVNRTTLGNFFLESYWHVIFGEAEQYHLPFRNYSMLPNVHVGLADATFSSETVA